MLGNFFVPHPGERLWLWSSFWLEHGPLWLVMKDAKNLLLHPLDKHIQKVLASHSMTFNCYKFPGPNQMVKDCMQRHQERLHSQVQKFHCKKWCFGCNGLGHVSSETPKERRCQCQPSPWASENQKLPAVKVFGDRQECTALLDSRCSQQSCVLLLEAKENGSTEKQ